MLALVGLFSCSSAHAGGIPNDVGKALGIILSYGVPVDPMHAGEWSLNLSPGYIVNQDKSGQGQSIDMKGWGAAGALTHAFTDHWGVALIFGGAGISGNTDISPSDDAGAGFFGFTPGQSSAHGSGRAILVAASLVWDFRSGDGFRLPVSAGLSFESLKETAEYAPLGYKTESTLDSPGLYFGVAPQFTVWKLRLVPFLAYSRAFSVPRVKMNKPGAELAFDATAGASEDGRQTHAFGLAVQYTPWNLGFTYVPDLEGITAFTLRWSRKFGGA